MNSNFDNSKLYSKLQNYTESWITSFIGLLWGFAEATLFFIVPDLYLGFVALFNWRKALLAAMWSIIGAIVGGSLMYIVASDNSPAAIELLHRVPLISSDMVQTVQDQVSSQGLVSLVSGPLETIPYKIYAVQAGSQNLPFLGFILMTIPARLERILPVTGMACLANVIFGRIIKRYPTVIISLYILLWIGIYLFYSFQLQ